MRAAAAIGGFDDDGAHGESADDAVALREHAGERRHRGRGFADDRALSGDFLGELHMLRRERVEHTAGEHGDRAAAGIERAAVGGGVDAAGHAADDC